jgi:hypothetical protein
MQTPQRPDTNRRSVFSWDNARTIVLDGAVLLVALFAYLAVSHGWL